MNTLRTTGSRSVILIASFSLLLASTLSVATLAQAAPTSHLSLPCSAHVDKPHPTDYSTVTVFIHTRGSARVTTIAHYRTTSNVKTTTANPSGSASVPYRISRATSGFKVVI